MIEEDEAKFIFGFIQNMKDSSALADDSLESVLSHLLWRIRRLEETVQHLQFDNEIIGEQK
jgi:hypothetical protein